MLLVLNRKHAQIGALILSAGIFGASPAWAERRGDMSVFVAVGDSLAAGSQNIGLEATSQENGFAALIARQARVNFPLPLVQYPGAPPVLTVYPDGTVGPASPPVVVGRVNPTVVPWNLAVPSFTLKNALEYRPNASVPRTPATIGDRGPLVLGIPGVYSDPALADCPSNPRPACLGPTMIEQAVARKPTTTLVWIGNNDALIPAMFGDLRLLTSVESFEADFVKFMNTLEQTGSSLVVATIPDVTKIPYFVSTEALADQYGMRTQEFGAKVGLAPGDYVRRSALPIIDSIVKTGNPSQLPAMCPPPIYLFPPLPCRFTAAEAEIVQDRTKEFNKIIAKQTHIRQGVLVDTHKLVNQMAKHGYRIGRERLTTDYLGGLFSLDGIHPSNTGYAIIANYFIEMMNARLGLRIPEVPVESVWALDPLRPHADRALAATN